MAEVGDQALASLECRGRQHFVAGVGVHIVLLGVHSEIVEPSDDGVVRDNMDGVVDNIIGMCHPLAANHELVVNIVAEGITHATVPTSDTDTRGNRVEQTLFLVALNSAIRPRRHDQILRQHQILILVSIEIFGDRHLVAFALEHRRKNINAFFGFVYFQASPYYHRFPVHRFLSIWRRVPTPDPPKIRSSFLPPPSYP